VSALLNAYTSDMWLCPERVSMARFHAGRPLVPDPTSRGFDSLRRRGEDLAAVTLSSERVRRSRRSAAAVA
jgi:hypothetical protein